MRQVLRAGAPGRPRGMGWGGRQEEGSGWEIHVNPWLIHVNVWQKPLQYCKVISLQLVKINGKKRCCESAAFNMPANLKNSAVAIGLEKVSFHPNPKERQCERMLKLLHNYTHLTR